MPLQCIPSESPIVLALPYAGTDMALSLIERLADRDRFAEAPDRFLDRLTEGFDTEVNYLRANFHRFLVDVEQSDLPPRRGSTRGMMGVVPLFDRDGSPIWKDLPSQKEAASWHAMWYVPYHAVLAAQIARVRAKHGHAIVISCRACPEAAVPASERRAPDIRMSTHMGASCALDLSSRLGALIRSWPDLEFSQEGRRGTGWSTRKYGRPAAGVHAIDIEINERNYLSRIDSGAYYDEARAATMREVLSACVGLMREWQAKQLSRPAARG